MILYIFQGLSCVQVPRKTTTNSVTNSNKLPTVQENLRRLQSYDLWAQRGAAVEQAAVLKWGLHSCPTPQQGRSSRSWGRPSCHLKKHRPSTLNESSEEEVEVANKLVTHSILTTHRPPEADRARADPSWALQNNEKQSVKR